MIWGTNSNTILEHYKDSEYYEPIEPSRINQEKKFGNVYYGRNVAWVGYSGRMLRLNQDEIYAIEDNIFYDDKIEYFKELIEHSPDTVYLYAPYGELTVVTLQHIKESIEYGDDEEEVLTTGDEDLDEYISMGKSLYLWSHYLISKDAQVHVDDYLNVYDSDLSGDEIFKFFIEEIEDPEDLSKEDFAGYRKLFDEIHNLHIKMENTLKDAVDNQDGDLGSIRFQIRDGNHRARAAFESGEPYIYAIVSDRQMQDVEEGSTDLSSQKLREILQ